MSRKNGEMQQLPQDRTLCKSMPQQNRKHENTKNKLPRSSTQRRKKNETEEIQQITQINRILPDKNDNYSIKVKINGKYQNFTINTGSPVTIMPNNPKLHNRKDIQPLKERHQDVNKNEIKFLGKIWANIEFNCETTKLPIPITKRSDITQLLSVNCLKQLPITINKILLDEPTNQPDDIYPKIHKLFEANHTIKNAEVKIQIKPGCYPSNRKADQYHITCRRM